MMMRKLIQPIRYVWYHQNHTLRWAILTVLLGIVLVVTISSTSWTQYLWSWGGTMFKALSGGLIGWTISRYVVGLDLSEIPLDKRPMAALSQSFLIGAFAIAVATGA